MKVHCFQYETIWENPPANFRLIDGMISAADSIGAGDLLVFPELSTTGFSMDVAQVGEPQDGDSFRYFSDLAARLQCFVIAGVARADSDTGLGCNLAITFGPSGQELSRYQKVHSFPLTKEGDHYLPGSEPVCDEISHWKVSATICYDLRFPELYRRAALSLGAEVLVVIANWPSRREEHWLALLRARAIENQAYVIGVNRCGSDPTPLEYSGASIIIDPLGEIVARAGDKPEILTATLDHDLLDSWRRDFPALADVRL